MATSVYAVWVRRVSIATAIAVALGYLPYHLYASSGLARYLRLVGERDRLHQENLKLHAQAERLRTELDALTDDDTNELSMQAVERAARDELGLALPGELVFKLEETP